MTRKNVLKYLELSNQIEREEGSRAYFQYNKMFKELARQYDFPLDCVIAGFSALSPNTDYVSNLRSLVSCLVGLNAGIPDENITVSTYNHGKARALKYLRGEAKFLEATKGLKTRAFYQNMLDPTENTRVTVDGHMVCIWRGLNLTMKEALLGAREYQEIESEIISLASELDMLGHQLQAILWLTRKRVQQIMIKPRNLMGDLFKTEDTNTWETYMDPALIKPYGAKNAVLTPEKENQLCLPHLSKSKSGLV